MMTQEMQDFILEESEIIYPPDYSLYHPKSDPRQSGYIAGAESMVRHIEGFAEWCSSYYVLIDKNTWKKIGVYETYTTSQILIMYLKKIQCL